jgi:hypothetical protein
VIRLFDAEMTKVRPSPSFGPTHPIWKAARTTVLTKLSPALEQLVTKREIVKAFRASFLEALSDSEADTMMSFITSPEGTAFFRATRLRNTYEVMQRYALVVATTRTDLPEFIPAGTVHSDLERIAEEIKHFPPISSEHLERIKAFAELDAAQRAAAVAVLTSLMQLSSDGHLAGVQSFAQTTATQAVEEFQKSQAAQAR